MAACLRAAAWAAWISKVHLVPGAVRHTSCRSAEPGPRSASSRNTTPRQRCRGFLLYVHRLIERSVYLGYLPPTRRFFYSRAQIVPKLRLNERFAVGALAGPRSSIWRLFSTGSDVYLTSSKGGVEKISFHQSRICRRAFISEHGTPPGMSDRVIETWKRNRTPPSGSNLAICVFELLFPTDYLSTAFDPTAKRVTWITPAPLHMSTRRHERGAGCDGRGGAVDEWRQSGRRNRVVLTSRRWSQVCDKKRRRRWQKSPFTGESTYKP